MYFNALFPWKAPNALRCIRTERSETYMKKKIKGQKRINVILIFATVI